MLHLLHQKWYNAENKIRDKTYYVIVPGRISIHVNFNSILARQRLW